MKIKRSKLRKIIREFVDTYKDSYRPSLAKPSVYEQLSNSERNAFIQAMGVVSKASGGEKLDEGTVTRFPFDRVRSSENEDEDPVGFPGDKVVNFMPYKTDLPGDRSIDVTESDPTDLSADELDAMLAAMESPVSGDSDEDWIYDLEGEMEAKMQGLESGKLVDLFDKEY